MKSDQILYGELVLIGSNGRLPIQGGDKGRRRSKFKFYRRPLANGIKPGKVERVKMAMNSVAVQSRETHAVSYTLSRNEAVVVEYEDDTETDMFQIGRSTDEHIDMCVFDTDTGNGSGPGGGSGSSESTISRFACRILVSRKPPHIARIFAAGFDSSRNIFLGEKAIRWRTDGMPDGLTTNGIMIMRPNSPLWPHSDEITEDTAADQSKQPQDECGDEDQIPQGSDGVDDDPAAPPQQSQQSGACPLESWREVSVGGGLYAMRQKRSIPHKSHRLRESNILVDGTLIDLCGATLLWRSNDGLRQTADINELARMVDNINQARPQCPVRYETLLIPRPRDLSATTASVGTPPPLQQQPCHRLIQSMNPGVGAGGSNGGGRGREDSKRMAERQPFVYLTCGHVHGNHEWKAETDSSENRRTCPLCIQAGPFVPLELGVETAFFTDREAASYAFNPCGHFASENTIRYWYSVMLPNRHNYDMHPQCPFCARVIEAPPVRIIFQEDI